MCAQACVCTGSFAFTWGLSQVIWENRRTTFKDAQAHELH